MKIGAISKADGTTFEILAERVKFYQNSKKNESRVFVYFIWIYETIVSDI